jgi:site-specific recombinase XerD
MSSLTELPPEEDIMIDRCFTNRFAQRRLADGPAGPFLAGFAGALLAEGYSADTCRRYLRTAADIGTWAARRGVAIAELDEEVLGSFVRQRHGKRRAHDRTPFQAQRFLRYLREAGIVISRAPCAFRSAMVLELVAWMRDQRGLADSTVARTARVAQAYLDALGEEPARWNASGVRKFLLGFVREHAPSSAGLAATCLRCFLRYLIARGRCTPEIVEAVPKVPTWRMTRLPRYLPAEDVERIIAACEGQEGTALRNRALLLLLARLGLRSHEVVGLRLGDIDWESGRLRVRGKGGREARLPLPQDVGDAIISYLRGERPTAPTDSVFLSSRAPIGRLRTAGLRDVVARAIECAGVKAPSHGPHLLRHSLAARLLRDGAALDTIGAVLRHRDVDTTALYAKVDVALLRQVAQPWPAEVSPC